MEFWRWTSADKRIYACGRSGNSRALRARGAKGKRQQRKQSRPTRQSSTTIRIPSHAAKCLHHRISPHGSGSTLSTNVQIVTLFAGWPRTRHRFNPQSFADECASVLPASCNAGVILRSNGSPRLPALKARVSWAPCTSAARANNSGHVYLNTFASTGPASLSSKTMLL
jgi:hypothetical protein